MPSNPRNESIARLLAHPYRYAHCPPSEVEKKKIEIAPGLHYYWPASGIDEHLATLLSDFSRDNKLVEQYKDLLSGGVMNNTEKRRVSHHLLRNSGSVTEKTRDLRKSIAQQRVRTRDLVRELVSGGGI